TTVANMKKTISAIRKLNTSENANILNNTSQQEPNYEVKIFVGGAVLNEAVAKEIGADFYSKDARQFVKLLETL
ncbi:MAG: hypothetical protein RR454_05955, partial [Clostridia bacterium]